MRRLVSTSAVLLASASVLVYCGKKSEEETKKGASEVKAGTALTITSEAGAVVLPADAVAAGSKVSLLSVAQPAEFKVANIVSGSTPVELAAKGPDGKPLTQASAAMTLSLLLPEAPLALADVEKKAENLCMFAKDATSALHVWRHASLTWEASARKVSVASKYFGSYQVVFCGQEKLTGFTEETSTPVVQPTQEQGGFTAVSIAQLQGNWVSTCAQILDEGKTKWTTVTLNISNESYEEVTQEYADQICENPTTKTVMGGTLRGNAELAEGRTLDVKITALALSPSSEQIAALFNQSSLLGFTDWARDVPKNLLGVSGMPVANTILYSKFKISETNALSFGDDEKDPDLDGSTPEKRPSAWEARMFEKQLAQ